MASPSGDTGARPNETVSSGDGTTIGFRTSGTGPGLVLVQGAMGTAQNFGALATALSESFAVHVPDRRGRGMSPRSFGDDYVIDRDIEDLAAVLDRTGARFVFGLSSGAIIALQAALSLPMVSKIAVYEPALFVAGLPVKRFDRFDDEMRRGKIAAAMVSAMRAGQMGPAALRYVPDWAMTAFVQWALKQESRQPLSADHAPLAELVQALPYDLKIVRTMNDKLGTFKGIGQEVLLIGGSKSPAFLKADLSALEGVLPKARRVELAGLDHASAWNRDKQRNPNGDPERVADALRPFFLESA